ncbi:MAG: type II toxin-antitoxin system RelE/ParE family toxin [Phormidesmis sp. CAN_BIN44]|nr:type II toxin-antitoxin system RelE/ParE family toxin [Phormidesmis sp. CAN_BIN44]
MRRYIIAPEASHDLDEIGDYFLARNVEAGDRWFQAFNQRCQQIVSFPEMGRGYPHIRSDLRGLFLRGCLRSPLNDVSFTEESAFQTLCFNERMRGSAFSAAF